jgi:chromosome segregation ATPase
MIGRSVLILISTLSALAPRAAKAEDRHAIDLKRAEAVLIAAERDYLRTERLVAAAALPAIRLYEASSELDSAKFEVARVKRDLEAIAEAAENLVVNYKEQLERVELLAKKKVATEEEVDEARLLLAEARVQREFVRIVEIQRRRLVRCRKLAERDAATKEDVERFRAKFEAAWKQVDANIRDE